MKLTLTRPLAVIDLETTGTDRMNDTPVEIAILKIFPDGRRQAGSIRINPIIPIKPEATAIHGITDEMVAGCPTFPEIAPKIMSALSGCDFLTFNGNRFDIPMLVEHMLREGYDFPDPAARFIDAQVIFHKKEERTLAAASKFYLGKELENAHSAVADATATYEVFQAQLERYPDLPSDIEKLSEYSRQGRLVDYAGHLIRDSQNRVIFNFGKHKDKPVTENLDYAKWMLESNFPLDTKRKLKQIIDQVEVPMFAR
ncbi:MAG: 3'-5' exonuclease [Bacteroidetes bacterium]|nr:3'-5' exonuclease [Bacteroidota bacterium]